MSRQAMRELVKEIEQAGWPTPELTSKGHYRVFTPSGIVIMASTPSDRRSMLNARARLHKHGLPR